MTEIHINIDNHWRNQQCRTASNSGGDI